MVVGRGSEHNTPYQNLISQVFEEEDNGCWGWVSLGAAAGALRPGKLGYQASSPTQSTWLVPSPISLTTHSIKAPLVLLVLLLSYLLVSLSRALLLSFAA